MAYNYQECEEYVRNIMQRIPVLRIKQLARALYKLCPTITSTTEAMLTLNKIQRKGYIFMSPDGFAITRGAYSVATGDRLLTKVNSKIGEFAIPDMGPLLQEKRLLTSATDCFWIACDFLPYSYEFIANLTPPWSVCFDAKSSDGLTKVYEVAKVKKGEGYQTAEILKSVPPVPDEAKSGIIRVAILEDIKEKDILPAVGFKFLCTIDENKPRGYKVIEKREGSQIWG